jgi:hypothetical protein
MLRRVVATSATYPATVAAAVGRGSSAAIPSTMMAKSGPGQRGSVRPVAQRALPTVGAAGNPLALSNVGTFEVPADVCVTLHMLLGAKVLSPGAQVCLPQSALSQLFPLAGVPQTAGPSDAFGPLNGPVAPGVATYLGVAEILPSGSVRDIATNSSYVLLEQWVTAVAGRQARVSGLLTESHAASSASSATPQSPSLHVSPLIAYQLVSVISQRGTLVLSELRPAYARRLCVAAAVIQSSSERLLHWHTQFCEHEGRAVELPSPSTVTAADASGSVAAKRKRPVVARAIKISPSLQQRPAILAGSSTAGVLPPAAPPAAAATSAVATAAASGTVRPTGMAAAILAAQRRTKQLQLLQQQNPRLHPPPALLQMRHDDIRPADSSGSGVIMTALTGSAAPPLPAAAEQEASL